MQEPSRPGSGRRPRPVLGCPPSPQGEPGQLILVGMGEMRMLGGEDKSLLKDRLFSPRSTRPAV